MAGLSVTGFLLKTVSEIIDDIGDDLKVQFGDSIDVSDDAILGRLTAIISAHIGEAWELGEAAYNAQDPDAATGAALDSLCSLTGTTREAATESTVTLTLTGTAATVVPLGSQASVVTLGDVFETTASATLVATTAWAGTTAYVLGDRVKNGGVTPRVYLCITAGTSAGSGGPTTTSADITDGTAHWRYLGEGTADIDVAAESAETGPVIGASGDITVIETPVGGWSSVINILDATLGTDLELNEDLRIRRVEELANPGTSPKDAIRADILAVTGVTACTVFVNNTDVTVDGIPPHRVEALVTGGADQDIWDQLLASVAGGIRTHGDEVGTADDSQGTAQDTLFTRPAEIDIYCTLTLTYDTTLYPADGDDQIETAIVAFGDAQGAGKDVTSSGVSAQSFGIAGVLDVSLAYIDTTPTPVTEATIAISARQIAMFDTSRIIINSSAATP